MLPSAKYTHPEHASFAESNESNVCAESKIYKVEAAMRISLTKAAISDGLTAVRIGFMSVHGAFEDFDATDELTSVSVGDVLELTKETTDRQTYPIYDAQDLAEKYSGSGTAGTNEMGLTSSQVLENVAFDPDLYYDVLNYYTISEKLKSVQNGLRWITLTQDNPTRVIKFRMESNVKASNPYAILAHMVYAPPAGTKYQIPIASDTSAVYQLSVDYRCRFLEWNDNFNHERA